MRHLIWLLLLAAPVAGAQCSASLTWTPPDSFENGDALDPASDLSGYGVYVDGQRHDTAQDGTTTGYVVEGMAADGATHEFTVTAIAAESGTESAMSNIATKACADMRQPNPPSGLIAEIVAFLQDLWARLFA